jgi:PDZ domain-containing secreted protein
MPWPPVSRNNGQAEKGVNMIDEQVKKIIDRTFSEVDILVKEVQKKKNFEENKIKYGEMKKKGSLQLGKYDDRH